MRPAGSYARLTAPLVVNTHAKWGGVGRNAVTGTEAKGQATLCVQSAQYRTRSYEIAFLRIVLVWLSMYIPYQLNSVSDYAITYYRTNASEIAHLLRIVCSGLKESNRLSGILWHRAPRNGLRPQQTCAKVPKRFEILGSLSPRSGTLMDLGPCTSFLPWDSGNPGPQDFDMQ